MSGRQTMATGKPAFQPVESVIDHVCRCNITYINRMLAFGRPVCGSCTAEPALTENCCQ